MANLGLILKESVMNASAEMTGDEFKGLVTGMFNYAVYGEQPNFETALQRVIFEMEKPAIDYNNQKWELKRVAYESESSKNISDILDNQRKVKGNFVGKKNKDNADMPF